MPFPPPTARRGSRPPASPSPRRGLAPRPRARAAARARAQASARAVVPALVLTLVLALSLAAAPAAASWTRARSLGGDADYFEDAGNVLSWYGSLSSYDGLARLELGDREDGADGWLASRAAGVHWRLDRAGRWGTAGLYLFPADGGEDLPGSWAVLYGRRLGGGQVGCLFGQRWGEFAATGDADEHHESLRDVTVGLGARWDLGEGAYCDLAGTWRGSVREFADARTSVRQDERSWGSFALRARLFLRAGETAALVPVAEYRRDDRLVDAGYGRPFAALDAWRSRFGLGLNLLPDEDLLGLCSLEWRRGRAKLGPAGGAEPPAFTGRYDLAVARLGLEARVRPWLTLRASAVGTDHFRGGDQLLRQAGLRRQFDLALGAGCHLGSLDLDLLLNDEAPFDLAGLAGGDDDSDVGDGSGAGDDGLEGAFKSVTLTYYF